MKFARVLLVFILRLAFIALKFFGYGLMYLPKALFFFCIGLFQVFFWFWREDLRDNLRNRY